MSQNMKMKGIIEILNTLVPKQGMKKDIIAGIDIFRIEESSNKVPMSYEHSIIIIAQGKKRAYIGEKVLEYDPMNYLVLSVPMSIECDTIATKEEPLFGIRIDVDATIVSDITLSLDSMPQSQKTPPMGIYSSVLEEPMIDAVYRLIESLTSQLEKQFLAPMYIREIIFRVLCSEDGTALRMLASRGHGYFRITRIIEKIHTNYQEKYDVDSLAREADMSVSAFHTAFKAITNASPIQYIKREKLHKARELIINNGLSANMAAYQVGYESTSQFNREYKRLFGITPGKDGTNVSYENSVI